MTSERDATLRQIEWWDAKRIRQARALVTGAGALGNELVKNLLLLGWGTIIIADFDHVEESNLSRSVLFDLSSVGKPKVEAIVQSAARLNPDCTVIGLGADVRLAVGAGLPARMDVVFGCVDNVAARVAIEQLAGRSGSIFIDGGLTTWEGTVRVFLPPDGPCYVCGLTEEDHRELRLRRSCLAYAARSQAAGGMPTTPTVASATAALMAQQALKWIHRDKHDLDLAVGCELRIDLAHDRFWRTGLVLNKQCVLHPEPTAPASAPVVSWEGSWLDALAAARGELGDPGLTFRLPVPVLSGWTCPQCHATGTVYRAHLPDSPVLCTACGQRAAPDIVYVLTGEEPWAQLSPRATGFPPWTWIEAESKDVSEVLELTGAPPELSGVADMSRS